jgi:hypothetical protein
MKQTVLSLAKRFLGEPLVQFLLLGAGLFVLYQTVSPNPEVAPNRIVVDAGQVERLAQQFERIWLRAPSASELSGLIESHVKEEIFYREALALGLERNDLVIRRRLMQKMEFLNDSIAERNPTDTELQAYLDAHPKKFSAPARTSFRQVYLKAEKDRARSHARAEWVRARLLASTIQASEVGDATLLPPEMENASARDVSGLFGEAFAKTLTEVPVGSGWQGPIESPYGLHLVEVNARDPGGPLPLSAVRDAVEREWQAGQRAKAQQAFYATLRERYQVSIEMPGVAKAVALKQ